MKEIIKKANRFVQKIETDWLCGVVQNIERWRHKAGACGCPSCRAGFEMRQRVMYEERDRLYRWHPDQEEEWIVDWIFNNRLNKD